MERKLNFSERYGYTKVSDVVQYECMNEELRTAIFNSFVAYIVITFRDDNDYAEGARQTLQDALLSYQYKERFKIFFRSFYAGILKQRVTTIPEYNTTAWQRFEKYFYDVKWHEVYSLTEWFYDKITDEKSRGAFCDLINKSLEKCLAGYRMLNGLIVPITQDNELSEIKSAMGIDITVKHLESALQCLHDKDYRNSVKESISALEAFARNKTGKSTLGAALSELERRKIVMPCVFKQGIEKIYGWTCGEDGIRHAIMDGAQEITMAEAKFMLVACSAFINYLKMKDVA